MVALAIARRSTLKYLFDFFANHVNYNLVAVRDIVLDQIYASTNKTGKYNAFIWVNNFKMKLLFTFTCLVYTYLYLYWCILYYAL